MSSLEGDLVGRPEQGMKIVQIDHLMGTHNQVNFTDEPTVEKQGVCHAVINGHKGLGQYILTRAMEKAIALAKENTIGMVWVYNWLDIRLRQRLRATRPGTWWVWPSPTPCP